MSIIRLFVRVVGLIGIFMIISFVIMLIQDDGPHSVLTEAGQIKEAARQARELEYQEWETQEDDRRLQQRKQKRFLRRYESGNWHE